MLDSSYHSMYMGNKFFYCHELSSGGTLSKGLNRAIATLVGGALGVAAHQIAVLCGEKAEPILLGLFVFTLGMPHCCSPSSVGIRCLCTDGARCVPHTALLAAAAATFSRFIPEIKARYDYGVTIFIMTFSLVTVSSYRVDELMQLALQRVSTIVVGVATCLCTSIFVFPVWAGEDLHKLVAADLEKLANFLEGI
ncbi:hypothetical protein GW17_00049847 [Ensete ventricosum]|nr:hypothetical protein GW17_00049847 [Ensete ventricosum]